MAKQIEGKITRIDGGVVTVAVSNGHGETGLALGAGIGGAVGGLPGAIIGAMLGGAFGSAASGSEEISIPLDRVKRIDHASGTVTYE